MNRQRTTVVLVLVMLISIVMSMPAMANEVNISHGKVNKGSGGSFTIKVTVKNAAGVKSVVEWTKTGLNRNEHNTSEKKAAAVRDAGPTNSTYIEQPSGSSGNTKIIPKAGFEIVSIELKDNSKEDDDYDIMSSAGVPSEDAIGVCSLFGTSTGLNDDGTAGFVSVTVLGTVAQAYTAVGMTAADVEDMILALFASAAVPARLAVPADNLAYYGMDGGDGRTMFFGQLGGAGLGVWVNDTGLSMDMGGLYVPEPSTLAILGLGMMMMRRKKKV